MKLDGSCAMFAHSMHGPPMRNESEQQVTLSKTRRDWSNVENGARPNFYAAARSGRFLVWFPTLPLPQKIKMRKKSQERKGDQKKSWLAMQLEHVPYIQYSFPISNRGVPQLPAQQHQLPPMPQQRASVCKSCFSLTKKYRGLY